MRELESKDRFTIFQGDDSYIVQNMAITDRFAHTHLHNLKTARQVVDLAISERLPNNLPSTLLVSLSRISDNETYVAKIESLLGVKSGRRQYYYNSQKGVRR